MKVREPNFRICMNDSSKHSLSKVTQLLHTSAQCLEACCMLNNDVKLNSELSYDKGISMS